MIWNGSLPFPNYKKVKLFCRVYVKHYTDMRMVYASVNVWLDPPGHRSTFVRLFVHHYFTLPLGPVRLAFTELHKSFVSHFAFCSTQKNASNARRIHKTIVRLVRRSSCSSTLFHRRKKRVRLAFLGKFFPYVSPYAKRTSFCTSFVHRRTMTWGGGVSPNIDGRIRVIAPLLAFMRSSMSI